MKQVIYLLGFLILIIGITSCEGIKKKAEGITTKVKERSKEELREQSSKIIAKVFPPFNHDEPDTKNNKERFKDFIKVELSPDIKNIYCFSDPIGINQDYMFAFNCNQSTSDKIIQTHRLTADTLNLDNGFGLQHDFEWWDKQRISELKKYSWQGKH